MNKKLLYCHLHNIDQVGKGIENKIFAQLKGFEDMGYQVSFLTLSNEGIKLNDELLLIKKNPFIHRILGPVLALKILKGKSYDHMYLRGFGVDFSLLYFLRKIKKQVSNIIFEFPTYPYNHELKGQGFVKGIFYFIDKLCNKRLKKYVSHSVNFDTHTTILGIPSTPISNAIDISKIEFTGTNDDNLKNDIVNIIGVAGLRFYHGFDRVIEGLGQYYQAVNKIKVYFHIVGDGEPELSKLRGLTKDLNLTNYVVFHGKKYGEELTGVFKNANVGIASLGMHRNGLENGSVLKVREYFSRGLPFLISYNDLAIQNYSPYYYKLPPNESLVDINELLNWLSKSNIDTKQMRIIAEKEFKWMKQFNRIPSFKLDV